MWRRSTPTSGCSNPPPSQADLDAIALQTGELYRTTELTTDGALPRFSPDGRTLLYETGPGLARLTRILPANGSTVPVTELHGFGAAYSPDGTRLAYLAVRPRRSSRGRRRQSIRDPRRNGPGVRPAFNELVAGGVTDCRPKPRNRTRIGSAIAGIQQGPAGVRCPGASGSRERAPATRRSRFTRVHDDGRRRAKHIRTPGPADRADERNRDGAAVHAARRRRERRAQLALPAPLPSSRPTPGMQRR